MSVTLDKLPPGRCKFPVGEVVRGRHLFCAEPRKDEKSPYCEHHHGICYVPLKKKERAA